MTGLIPRLVNILAFYSSTIFAKEGRLSNNDFQKAQTALLLSFGFGLVNFIFAWLAFYLIDRLGRRALLLLTFPFMFASLLIAGLCSLITSVPARPVPVAIFVYLFVAFYSPGVGPIAFYVFRRSISHYPSRNGNELGSSRMSSRPWTALSSADTFQTNNFFASILSLTFLPIDHGLGDSGAFGLFAGLNVVALVLVYFFVRETRQINLEELAWMFDVSTTEYLRDSIFSELPWFWRTRKDGQIFESAEMGDASGLDILGHASEPHESLQLETLGGVKRVQRRVSA